MGLFNKKKKEEIPESANLPELPELPKLPKLPELPPVSSSTMSFKPNMLPRFPSNSLGNKFSQDTIKDAVSGEKEDESADESEEEIQTMPKLPTGSLTREVPSSMEQPIMERPMMKQKPMRTEYVPRSQEKSEPIFVRLDKFEENMELFEKIKKQLSGVERILDDIKHTKEEEDKELAEWQDKLQTMKGQIDKIDRDIFSKIG